MSENAHWIRLSALFDRAIDLDASARTQLLDTECEGDPALRAALQKMLDADAATSGIDMGARGLVDLSKLAIHEDEDPLEDSQAGPWRLQELLGRGGMGSVHAAVREDDNDHRAAVKRLHRRWDGSAQAERFLQERRILASLSHRNLPRLIDHGVDQNGRPWFALEYVDGDTLIAWADAHRLNLRARLDLFRQVCAAVQHAHEHFVVHRDLKPANILVDNQGHPKVLDFGVAKRIDDIAGNTRTGAFAGFTPEYAAPEQISGGIISAATDVYALGVILYQLLTGQLPYHVEHDNLRDAAEAITTRTAARMDKALVTGEPEEIAERIGKRHTTPAAFRRFVRGDLSRIVQTALAKEPHRRYASVQAFSDDLKRFLEGRPVSVSGDTFVYRSRKFVRRNRWAVAVSGAAAVAVVAALGMALWQASIAREHARSTAKVKDFVTGLLSAASPEVALGQPLTVREVLDRGAAQLGPDLDDDANVAIELMTVIGRSYASLDQREDAHRMLDRAEKIAPGADDLQRAHLADAQLQLALSEGGMPRARIAGQVLQTLMPRVGGARDRVAFMLTLADLDAYEGQMEETAKKIDAAITLARSELDAGDIGLIHALQSRLNLMQVQGDSAGMIPALQEALGHARRSLSPTHPTRLMLDKSLVTAYITNARFAEGIALHQEIVRRTRSVYGKTAIGTAFELASLCHNQILSGDYLGARASCASSHAIYSDKPEEGGAGRSQLEFSMASIAHVEGNNAKAIELQKVAISRLSAATGYDQQSMAFMHLKLVRYLLAAGRAREANLAIERVLASALPAGTARALALIYQGVLARDAGDIAKALQLHEQAISLLDENKSKRYNYLRKAGLELSRDQFAQGKHDASLATLQLVVGDLATKPPYEWPELGEAWCELGQLQARKTELRASSRANLRLCVDFRNKIYGKTNEQTASYRRLLTTTAIEATATSPNLHARTPSEH